MLGGDCHVMALVITPLGILESWNEHVSVSGLDFRSRVITRGGVVTLWFFINCQEGGIIPI